jgi:hypothetical protein
MFRGYTSVQYQVQAQEPPCRQAITPAGGTQLSLVDAPREAGDILPRLNYRPNHAACGGTVP